MRQANVNGKGAVFQVSDAKWVTTFVAFRMMILMTIVHIGSVILQPMLLTEILDRVYSKRMNGVIILALMQLSTIAKAIMLELVCGLICL